jgi:hypothetical protein
VRLRSFLILFVSAATAHAQPVASTERPVEPGHELVVDTPAPDAEKLAAAPPADKASGVAIAHPRQSHRFANTLLALPRMTVLLLLEGPRYAAGEVDDYLESRSPNAFGRDVAKRSWRFGATLEWQTALGTSLAARIGRELADHTALDAYVGMFGPRGQSGGLNAILGRYTVARIEPTLSFDAGRDLTRAFAGIGEHGPRGTYDQRGYTAAAGVAAHAGPVRFGVRGSYDDTHAGDPSSDFAYDPMMLFGFDEDTRATTGELSVTLDMRRRAYRHIVRSSPSSGPYVRGAVAYTAGETSRSGDFTTARGTLEARYLFDLFAGNRVLSIGAGIEAITADAMEVPFDRLPTLGGRDHLRAFAMGELRDRDAGYADIQYDWPVGNSMRGFVFAEVGHTAAWHGAYGGGIRYHTQSAIAARVQLAGSDDGDLGMFFQLGAL